MTKRLAPWLVWLVACGGGTRSAPSGTTRAAGKLSVSAALMLPIDDGAIAPVACWNAEQKRLEGGDRCLALITPGTAVRFDDGNSAQVQRQGPNPGARCGVSRVASVQGGEGATFAVWPDNAVLRIQSVGDLAKGVTPDAAETQALEALAHSAAPDTKQGLQIFQAVELDADSDGKLDRLYSVGIENGDPSGPRFAFSALVYRSGGRYAILESSQTTTWKLESTLDLDHDGRPELWLTTEVYDSGTQTATGNLIAHIAAGSEPKLDAVGEITCYRS